MWLDLKVKGSRLKDCPTLQILIELSHNFSSSIKQIFEGQPWSHGSILDEIIMYLVINDQQPFKSMTNISSA